MADIVLSRAPNGTFVGQLQILLVPLDPIVDPTGTLTIPVRHIWTGTAWVPHDSETGVAVQNELHSNIPPVKPVAAIVP